MRPRRDGARDIGEYMNVQLKHMFGWGEAAIVALVSTRPQLHGRSKIAFKDTKFQFTSVQSRLSEASKHFRTDLRRPL